MPYLVGPDIYSRVLCARSERVARNASLVAAGATIPLSFLLAGLGMLIAAVFPGLSPDAALPTALGELAPPGLKGLIVVGVLGAIMSSADTTLVSASTILSVNVAGPLLDLDEKDRLRYTRMAVVALGAMAWALASFQEGIIDALLLAYTVFVGGVAIPTLASFWRGRLGITSRGAFWAVVVGGATALLGQLGSGPPLGAVVGEKGVALLRWTLGPEYSAILPLVLSTAVLFGIRGPARGKGAGVLGLEGGKNAGSRRPEGGENE
jgi:SSS family solute:Na+ symporter